MNKSEIAKRYPLDLPEKMSKAIDEFESLSKQRGIVSVKLMSNFGLDVEQTLLNGNDIYKGVVVETSSDYTLSDKDRMWFHPQLFKSRTVVEKSQLASNAKVSAFSSNVGLYSSHKFDELGGHTKTNYAIADDYDENVSKTSLNHWIVSKMSIKDVYTDMHSAKVDGMTLKEHSLAKLNEQLTPTEITSSTIYNVLYRGNSTYLFYNHAIKPTQGKALVHISPLMGYVEIKTDESAVASDLMSADEYMDIREFTPEQRKRAYVDCNWEGKNIVNTFIMRKPIDNYTSFIGKDSTRYMMQKGVFSSNPIVDKLPPHLVLFLTPEVSTIPKERLQKLHSHIRNGIFKISSENGEQLFKKHWKTLISKKIC